MTNQESKWAGPVHAISASDLAEHHAIMQLSKIYAIGLDMRDYGLARSAFAPDAMIVGKEGLEPVDESLPKTYAVAESFHATQHFIGNQYVELNGDKAVLWSYGVAHHKVAPGEERDEIIAGVQYRDRCKKGAQGWAIVERSVFMQWLDMGPGRSKI